VALAERAFIMVWDGMRPDLVSPELTPNLARLAAGGVWFSDSHAVFPTVTRVNSASLATGVLPAVHGIVGNSLYAPRVDPRAAISVGDHRSLEALIESRGGRLVPRDTLADRVAQARGRTVVVSTGSPGSAILCHPRVRECPGDRIFNKAIMLPAGADRELTRALGAIPETTVPNTEQDAYFARAIAEYVLPELDPRLLIFWHTDPDATQHSRGFGSPEGLAAIRDADANLGGVLAAIERSGRREETAIAVVSDHGYVSVEPRVEATAPLVAAGLGDALESGRLVLATNGCSLYANVPDGDAGLIRRVAVAFQAWEHGGPVFSGARGLTPAEGTLPLSLVGLDGELAPDVLCALAWDDTRNEHSLAGRSAGLDPRYLASHGGISPWEIRNTMVLAGPGLKAGLEDSLPAGTVDLAPTLLHLLGLEPTPGQQGRVLAEALLGGPEPGEFPVGHEWVTGERGAYRQRIRFSRVGAARYLDFGRPERGVA
jgi:phosphonoacetate hydrolase